MATTRMAMAMPQTGRNRTNTVQTGRQLQLQLQLQFAYLSLSLSEIVRMGSSEHECRLMKAQQTQRTQRSTDKLTGHATQDTEH